jgi:hypothetical protein
METTHPVHWLRSLEADPSAIGRLVEESGSLVLAAHRIARARCGTPTAREVAAVAKELAVRVGYFDVLPSRGALAEACGIAGA